MRRSVALVLTAGLLPIIALGGAFGVVTLRAERNAVYSGADTGTRFIAELASVRLIDGMHEVNMIAQSPVFDQELDKERFRLLAGRLRESAPNWRFLSIADAQGRRLVDVPEPIAGQEGGPAIDLASLRRAVETRKPVVGNVVAGPAGKYAFAVRAPVIRGGQVRYVVSAVIPAESAATLLRFRELPKGWRAGILDGAGNVVASSDPASTRIGQAGSNEGRDAKKTGKPGFYNVTRSDGSDAVVAWQPIAGTNWSAHMSAPLTSYQNAGTGALTLLIVAVVLSLALVALLVRLMTVELRQFRAREMAAVQGQRLEALGRLTGGVAHDFNNLLQPVLSGLDLLSRRVKDDEKSQRYIALAVASAERARQLVARLLAFSRKQTLASAPVDVGQMISGIAELLERSVSPTAHIAFDIPELLPLVQADATQLELAVLNLAINARDAMPDGGSIVISAREVIEAKANDLAAGRYVAISVTDNGSGMDEATMRHAIEPFFTTKGADKGTGLGLSMVHGFAAQSGGALRLESTQGQGTSATILMPLANDQSALPKPAEREHRGTHGRVVLVDDDEQVRKAVAEVLREAGHVVMEAASVDNALGIIAASDGQIDLVITDYLMPERSGGELIGELKTRAPTVPVLLITGYETHSEQVPDGIVRLGKPFRSSELLARVEALLDGAEALEG